jgi:ribonuclease R
VKRKRDAETTFPSRDDIVAFIRSQPSEIGTREIARAFGLKNADRIELKKILRELSDDGLVAKRGRKTVHLAGELPPVLAADITGRDEDGELIAVPAEWDEERGTPPKILVQVSRRAHAGVTGGVGDRVLLRIEHAHDQDEVTHPHGRIIKLLDTAKHRVLGIFRALPDGSGRMVPIDKKNVGRELAIASRDSMEAQDGDLISVEIQRGRGFGLPSGRVKERLGSLKTERAVSLIAIHAHDIPHVFPPAVLQEAEAAQPATLEGREDWRALPLVTIDPVDARTTTTPSTPNPTRIRKIAAVSSFSSPSPTSPITSAPARASTRKPSFAATRSISPIASCRCCPSASRTTSARYASSKTAPASPCA